MQIYYLFTKTTKAKQKNKTKINNQHTTEPTDNFIYIICKVGCARSKRADRKDSGERQHWVSAANVVVVVVALCRNAGSHPNGMDIYLLYMPDIVS